MPPRITSSSGTALVPPSPTRSAAKPVRWRRGNCRCVVGCLLDDLDDLDAAGPGPDDGDPLAGEVQPLLWPQGGVVPAALDVLSMTHTASGRGPARHARSGAEQ